MNGGPTLRRAPSAGFPAPLVGSRGPVDGALSARR